MTTDGVVFGVLTRTAPTAGSATTVISAPPEVVWPLVSDPTGMGRFSPENQGARWRGGATGPAVDARFRGFNRRGPLIWYTECVIRQCDPERILSFDVTFPPILSLVAQWTWLLEPVERGPSGVVETKVTLAWKLPAKIDRVRQLMWRALGIGDRSADLTKGSARTLRALSAYVANLPQP